MPPKLKFLEHGSATTGRTPAFYPAPGGNWGATPTFRALLTGKDLLPLGWAVDSEDWRRSGVPAIVANVMNEVTLGAVILLHDAGGNRLQTLTALPIVIRDLYAAGYTISAMPPPQVVAAAQPTSPTTVSR